MFDNTLKGMAFVAFLLVTANSASAQSFNHQWHIYNCGGQQCAAIRIFNNSNQALSCQGTIFFDYWPRGARQPTRDSRGVSVFVPAGGSAVTEGYAVSAYNYSINCR